MLRECTSNIIKYVAQMQGIVKFEVFCFVFLLFFIYDVIINQ